MVAGTQASATMTNVKVITGNTSKPHVFGGNHDNDWTIWEMKMSALDACLDS